MVDYAQVQAVISYLVQVRHSKAFIVIFLTIYNVNTFLVNCVWGSWSSYGSCDSNSGKQSRSRSKTIVEKNGGTCLGLNSDIKFCAGETLKIVYLIHDAFFDFCIFLVNCVWGSWTSYDSCNSYSGKQSRSRSKTIVEKNGGSCSGSSSDIRSCAGKTLTIV